MLLRYRLVIRLGRPGPGRHRPGCPRRAVLAGLTCGALLVGGLAVAGPAGGLPDGLQAALGLATTASPSTGRSTAPDAEPVRRLIPDLPTLAAPPAITSPPPTWSAVATTSPDRAPAPTTAPPPTPSRRPASSGAVAAAVALTNEARASAGCAPLRTDARITAAAQAHSADMAERRYFDHNSPDGRSPGDRMIAAGYPSPGGENIARGQRDAAEVVRDWLDSPGHRRNIDDCSFTTIGVGLDERGHYWTQDFGR